jgi:hypothetical protein
MDSQLQIFSRAQENVEFAIGLGEGFGRIFVYLNKELREKILEDLGRDNEYYHNNSNNNNGSGISGNGFSRGIGIGLGKNFAYLRKIFEFRIFAQALANTQFAIGLGEGLGYVFCYFDSELQNKILQKSNENIQLARGLGIGLGHIFYYLNDNKELQDKIFSQMKINMVFAESIGACLSHNFSQLKKDYNSLQKILVKAEELSEFAKGICLEEGFDDNIKCLNKQSQDRLIDVCKLVYKKHGHNKNKFLCTDYPVIGFPKDMYYSYTYEEDKEDKVVDEDMKEYLQMILDEIKNKKDPRT